MAAEPNTGFSLEEAFGAAPSRHAISFQSGAINSSSEMIPVGNFYGMNSITSGMMPPGSSSIISNHQGISQSGNSPGSLLLDSVPGLKHDTGSTVEWSVDEQYKLEQGLLKFGDEPSILKYIKIAATLHDKTVRDVALRCRWMMRKRRKQEEHNVGKKVRDRKDNFAESSFKTSIPSASASNMAAYPFMLQHQDQTNHIPCEAVSGATKHLLEQNNQVLGQISANLTTLELQDNIDLFCRTRKNISAILNEMRYMPGIMSRMPPLPVCINEELAKSIFPSTTQTMMFGSSNHIDLKQEPGC